MNIEDVKITPEAVEKVCAILSNNYGSDIDFKTMSNANLDVFLATAIEAAYRIGFLDGAPK